MSVNEMLVVTKSFFHAFITTCISNINVRKQTNDTKTTVSKKC